MQFENAYFIQGLALAFSELDQTNILVIKKEYGSGWDELLRIITDLLKGLKCRNTGHCHRLRVADFTAFSSR